MFNFELLFLHGFSSKKCEILNKAVLTPQEYDEYFVLIFFRKNAKKSKNLLGVSTQVKIGLKKPLTKINLF